MARHDATPVDAADLAEEAAAVAELFPAIYLLLHRRRPKGERRDGQLIPVLQHLARTGPLTVGETAKHLDRAQSVVSELIDRLEQRGLVARLRDARDRRRALVWLTPAGQDRLAKEHEILSRKRLRGALARMNCDDRRALVASMRALVSAASEQATELSRSTSNASRHHHPAGAPLPCAEGADHEP